MILAANICLLWAEIGWFLCIRKSLSSKQMLFVFMSSSIVLMLLFNATGLLMNSDHKPYSVPEFLALLINRNGILPLLTVLYLLAVQNRKIWRRRFTNVLFLFIFDAYLFIEKHFVQMDTLSWPIWLTSSILYLFFIRFLSYVFAQMTDCNGEV